MAKLRSLIKLEGTLDGLTFYKTKDGYLVRTKGGVSKQRMATDPAYARTRENGAEFGHCAKMGKVLRKAMLTLLTDAKDGRTSSRIMQTLSKVKNTDETSVRGQRNVSIGLATLEGKALLKGFDFNTNAPLSTVLLADYTLNTTTVGMITEITLSLWMRTSINIYGASPPYKHVNELSHTVDMTMEPMTMEPMTMLQSE